MPPAISIRNLSKCYRVNHAVERAPYRTLRDTFARATNAPLRRLRGETNGKSEKFWALKDVEIDVQPGEVVGIIGSNGAGKSTLLKIVSRITSPTTGEVTINGRVGSLLEVGTGFHPELTGRENIFMNGSILGMSRREITRKFEEIVAFAEIERFLDTPVKRYSSGMYVRLAFAVAAHLAPEILVIDEVLAVGDAQFQKKCTAKMGEAARRGNTVLFVSHNLLAVEAMCSRAILLGRGNILATGDPRAVVAQHLGHGALTQGSRQWDDMTTAPGGSCVRLRRVAVQPAHATDQGVVDVHTELTVALEYWNLVDGLILNPSVTVFGEDGRPIFNTVPTSERNWNGRRFPRGLFRSTFVIPGDLLNDGVYEIQILMVRDCSVIVERFDSVVRFQVADDPHLRKAWFGKWVGVVRPSLPWNTELIEVLSA